MTTNHHKDVIIFAEAIFRTGSRVICSPAPTDTDDDYLVLANSYWCAFDIYDHLEDLGYTYNSGEDSAYDNMGSFDDEEGFMSFKKGEVNYIITPSKEFFTKFGLATLAAKEQNLLNKADRIALFRKFLYGE